MLRVAGGQSFAGKFGTLQRYDGVLARWVNVKRVVLRADSTGVFPTVISASSFRSTVSGATRGPRRHAPTAGRRLLPARAKQHDPELAAIPRRCGRSLSGRTGLWPAPALETGQAPSPQVSAICRIDPTLRVVSGSLRGQDRVRGFMTAADTPTGK